MDRTAQDIISKIKAAGAETAQQIVDALEDGALLADLGIGDSDQAAVEEAHDLMATGMAASGPLVRLTRIDSGFSNVSPEYLIGDHYDGSSSLAHPALDYMMPRGFEVARSVLGEMHVYDANGRHHDVVARQNGEPGLAGGDRIIPLVPARYVVVSDGQYNWVADKDDLREALEGQGWTNDGRIWIEPDDDRDGDEGPDAYTDLCGAVPDVPVEPHDDWERFILRPDLGGNNKWEWRR